MFHGYVSLQVMQHCGSWTQFTDSNGQVTWMKLPVCDLETWCWAKPGTLLIKGLIWLSG